MLDKQTLFLGLKLVQEAIEIVERLFKTFLVFQTNRRNHTGDRDQKCYDCTRWVFFYTSWHKKFEGQENTYTCAQWNEQKLIALLKCIEALEQGALLEYILEKRSTGITLSRFEDGHLLEFFHE